MTSLGILLATLTRSMAQFCMLLVLIMLPLQMLSGASTPRESMPSILQTIMLASPTTHYVAASQAILFRGAGIDIVWPDLLAMVAIGGVFFWFAHARKVSHDTRADGMSDGRAKNAARWRRCRFEPMWLGARLRANTLEHGVSSGRPLGAEMYRALAWP
jgi:uncharacterized phage infection (PIP) family protein YhgE